MGALGQSCFPSRTLWSTCTLLAGPSPSLAPHRSGCPTPASHCRGAGRLATCLEPGRRREERDRHVLVDAAARYGLRGCSATPGLHRRPAFPPPSPPAPFSAGNETSSNYSSRARKSGRSRGPRLTQLRSAMSGRPARSPFSPLVYSPRSKRQSSQLCQQRAAPRGTGKLGSGKDGGERAGGAGGAALCRGLSAPVPRLQSPQTEGYVTPLPLGHLPAGWESGRTPCNSAIPPYMHFIIIIIN